MFLNLPAQSPALSDQETKTFRVTSWHPDHFLRMQIARAGPRDSSGGFYQQGSPMMHAIPKIN
eukprot:2544822-Amphidinium_carterae.1